MTKEPVKRRLAAIVAADMVGYSRLMQSDETGTLTRQKAILHEVVEPLIAAHEGHLVKTTGDGFLAEFSSAVAALTCAASIQSELVAREADVPDERRIAYRIGLNVGEVIFDDGDIFGDGVNVAARLEGLADPNGILISEAVFQTVQGKLDLGFEDIGAQQIKNIREPVRAYRVLLDPEDAGLVLDAKAAPGRRRWPLMLAVTALVAGLVAVAGLFPRETPPVPVPEPQAIRLLVLPYTAADADSVIRADAVSENLWLTLARLRGATMVARKAALTLEGIDPTPEQIAAQGPVTHLLSGRVSTSNGQVTIASQLRTAEGMVVWEQKSTGTEAELLVMLAQHKTDVTSALKIPLSATERDILEDTYTNNPQVFLDFARATTLRETYHWNNFPEALRLFEAALQADPGFVAAQTGYAQINYDIWRSEWAYVRNTLTARQLAEQAADAALALDPNSAQALSVKVFIRMFMRRYDEALALAQGAVFRNAADPTTHLALGWALLSSGEAELARVEFESYAATAPRLTANEAAWLANAWSVLNQPDRALAVLDAVSKSDDNPLGRTVAAAVALVRTGQIEAAQVYITAMQQAVPFINVQWMRHLMDFYRDPAVWSGLSADLMVAGMPEWPFGYDLAHAGDRLDHDALTALYAPGFSSINGIDELGGELRFRAHSDGRLEMANSYLSDTYKGTWRIDGDLVCNTFADILKGREVCEQVYRDPESPGRRIVQVDSFGLRRLGISQPPTGPDR